MPLGPAPIGALSIFLCLSCGGHTHLSSRPDQGGPDGPAAAHSPSTRFSASRPSSLPPLILWAWQEPEDLRSIDPHRIAVAELAETILLSDHLTAAPRHQPLRLATGTRVIAVVRIEAIHGFHDSPALRSELTRELAGVAALPSIAALQLDFDAVVSQYPFYAAVLRALHQQLPAQLPLTITALVSWCHPGSWLTELPIDEAIPMFFRMGGPAVHTGNAPNPLHPNTPTPPPTPTPSLVAPCSKSLGLSIDEPWPRLPPGVTLYLFSPAPWTATDLHTLDALDLANPHPTPAPTR